MRTVEDHPAKSDKTGETMSTSDEPTRARQPRTGSRELARKLTEERSELLSLYCQVAGVEPFSEPGDVDVRSLLRHFRQVMVDYLAAGHFGLYERIVNGTERRRGVSELAEKLYPRIAQTTDVAMAFHDKYDLDDDLQSSDDFERDLSSLGEALASRIEMEDRLLRALY